MELTEFPEQTTVFAKDQPEYMPLPAHVCQDKPETGRIVCCWALTWWERLRLLWTGRIWHHILTFNTPLQPQLLQVDKPDMVAPVKAAGIGTMPNADEDLAYLIKAVARVAGVERAAVCAVDCLKQRAVGQYDETVAAWQRYLQEVHAGGGHCATMRYGVWVPAIPL
jgi:hypothetical protein